MLVTDPLTFSPLSSPLSPFSTQTETVTSRSGQRLDLSPISGATGLSSLVLKGCYPRESVLPVPQAGAARLFPALVHLDMRGCVVARSGGGGDTAGAEIKLPSFRHGFDALRTLLVGYAASADPAAPRPPHPFDLAQLARHPAPSLERVVIERALLRLSPPTRGKAPPVDAFRRNLAANLPRLRRVHAHECAVAWAGGDATARGAWAALVEGRAGGVCLESVAECGYGQAV